jgi:hypothetical protein
MKAPQIENLRAQMRGVKLNTYQRSLALDEYVKLEEYALSMSKTMDAIDDIVYGGGTAQERMQELTELLNTK